MLSIQMKNSYFESHKQLLKVFILQRRDHGLFSITIDNWTAINQNAYLGITIHWINKHWELQSKYLKIAPLKAKHDGVYIAKVLLYNLRSFGIEDYIFRYKTIY